VSKEELQKIVEGWQFCCGGTKGIGGVTSEPPWARECAGDLWSRDSRVGVALGRVILKYCYCA
jgi:hypothetical protein